MKDNVKVTMRSGAVIDMSVAKINLNWDKRGRVINFEYTASSGSFVPMHLVLSDIESIWVDQDTVTRVRSTL